jgi:pyruvate formate lyase activating enzyme
VQLLPFHQFGERKYDLLGWDYRMAGVAPLHEEDLVDYIETFRQQGIHAYV